MAYPPSTLQVVSFTLRMITSSLRVQSPYSFAQTAYDFMGGMWAAEMTLRPVGPSANQAIMAWIARLNGPFGIFEMAPLDHGGPSVGLSANPTLVSAVPVRAQTLVLQFAASGEAATVGDYLTHDGHLHIVKTVDAPTAAYQQTVTVWPRLRSAISAGDEAEMLAPYGTWALADASASYSKGQSGARTRTFSLIEAL